MTKRHVCANCGHVTFEMTAAEVKALRKPRPVKVVEKIVREKPPKLTRRARMFLLRGVDVPPALEADWKTMKASGMSAREAADALGLPYFNPSERGE